MSRHSKRNVGMAVCWDCKLSLRWCRCPGDSGLERVLDGGKGQLYDLTYFLWSPDHAVVKIGTSCSVFQRATTIAASAGVRLVLLGVTKEVESSIHSRVAHLNMGWTKGNAPPWMLHPGSCGVTEWFLMAPELILEINRLHRPTAYATFPRPRRHPKRCSSWVDVVLTEEMDTRIENILNGPDLDLLPGLKSKTKSGVIEALVRLGLEQDDDMDLALDLLESIDAGNSSSGGDG